MSEQIPYLSELFRIISGALRLDTVKVRNYVSFLADRIEKSGDTATASRLRLLLSESDHQLRPADLKLSQSLPVDGETRFALLERVSTEVTHEPQIILSAAQRDLVNEFVSVAKSQAQFEVHGISVPTTLLLYGPPGCGKNRLARHIAHDLGLPLYLARLDGLISSFLGSTAKNIRAIFEFAASHPCALLLDEFDAIAKLRDDKLELGELKRVVNSFLQNLDSLGSQSVVIAATNHHQLLDSAVWRRFSYTLELGLPFDSQRIALWKEFLGPIQCADRDLAILSDLTEGFSGADIKGICFSLRRYSIAENRSPNLHDAFMLLQRFSSVDHESKRFVAALKEREKPEIARRLKQRNPKLYSHSHLGALLGTSKATAHRWTTGGIATNV